jgi:hypothetical protein
LPVLFAIKPPQDLQNLLLTLKASVVLLVAGCLQPIEQLNDNTRIKNKTSEIALGFSGYNYTTFLEINRVNAPFSFVEV